MMMLMSWVELHSIFEWSCRWKGGEGIHPDDTNFSALLGDSPPSPFPDTYLPLLGARLYSLDLFPSSAKASASRWSSSSNSLLAPSLVASDGVGLLVLLWRADTFRWIATNFWHKNSFSCLDSPMAEAIFFDTSDMESSRSMAAARDKRASGSSSTTKRMVWENRRRTIKIRTNRKFVVVVLVLPRRPRLSTLVSNRMPNPSQDIPHPMEYTTCESPMDWPTEYKCSLRGAISSNKWTDQMCAREERYCGWQKGGVNCVKWPGQQSNQNEKTTAVNKRQSCRRLTK